MSDQDESTPRRWMASFREMSGELRPSRALGRLGDISMASRLTMVVLLVTIVSLIVVSVVSLTYGEALAQDLFDRQANSSRSLRATEVEQYLNTTILQTGTLAGSPMVIRAAEEFTDAFVELNSGAPDAAAEERVAAFYRDVFAPVLSEANNVVVPWQDLVPVSPAAIHLQDAYVVGGADEGDPSVVVDADDGSEWSAVHSELHPRLLEISDRLGIDDLLIIEPLRGAIVYSTAKEPDFATGLDRGPYSGSTLASVMREVRDAPEGGVVTIADLAPYEPALGDPVGFLAAPILDGGSLVGILATRLPLDALNAIMTSDGDWEDEGFGETGETYLVGADGRMRSISRFYLDDPGGYIDAALEAQTLSEEGAADVEAHDTTVVFQHAVDVDTLRAVAAGDRSVMDGVNYLGTEVFASYEPLEVAGLDWFVAVEVGRDQVVAPLVDFRRAVLIGVSLFVLVITFVSVAWARNSLAPVRGVGERLRLALVGEEAGKALPKGGPVEMSQLVDDIDRMMDMTTARGRELRAASAERLDTLRGLLPPQIVERIEAGDRLVVDQILQATVVVVVVEGLGELIRTSNLSDSRAALDEVVTLLDTAADTHGLERVKVIGDVYYAACGLSHPHLDHAPRSVAFAAEVVDAITDEADRLRLPLRPAVGVHSGPLSVGLAGSSRLVYDVWGESLTTTYLLAQQAAPGEVLVSDATHSILPTDLSFERGTTKDGEDVWTLVAPASEPAP